MMIVQIAHPVQCEEGGSTSTEFYGVLRVELVHSRSGRCYRLPLELVFCV